MKKNVVLFSVFIIILTITVSSVGLFWSDNGEPYFVQNVSGEKVKVFGDGLYKHDSFFKAPINKGTDAVMLFIVVPLFCISTLLSRKKLLKLYILHLGLLCSLLYYSASISFGVAYNNLFILYIMLFSACLFTFVTELVEVGKLNIENHISSKIPRKGLVIFLIVAGLSVFVWLIEIIGAIKSGMPPKIIGISTTEPTFVIDIGIIAPSAFYASMLVYKRKPIGIVFAIVLLMLNAVVGLIVISQTIFQYKYGVIISIQEFIPYVSVFVLMSVIATFLINKTLNSLKK